MEVLLNNIIAFVHTFSHFQQSSISNCESVSSLWAIAGSIRDCNEEGAITIYNRFLNTTGRMA